MGDRESGIGNRESGIGDSPEETLRVDASAASHRVRGSGIGDRESGIGNRKGDKGELSNDQ
ncbi:hypothetical protein BLD44_021920 [Mastigocladus laminosus UU774]|nr:hypothetical protein BLD44_021920 [Mastigocladus laminosus UU774]